MVRLQFPVTQSNTHLGVVVRYFEDVIKVYNQSIWGKGDCPGYCGWSQYKKSEGLNSRAEDFLKMKSHLWRAASVHGLEFQLPFLVACTLVLPAPTFL